MMLNSVSIDYFGTNTPLNQVANINTPNSQTISVQPWDKSIIPEIEKAIITSNLGFNPMNNGESVIINVPPLTCLLYTSPSPRDGLLSRMPSSA